MTLEASKCIEERRNLARGRFLLSTCFGDAERSFFFGTALDETDFESCFAAMSFGPALRRAKGQVRRSEERFNGGKIEFALRKKMVPFNFCEKPNCLQRLKSRIRGNRISFVLSFLFFLFRLLFSCRKVRRDVFGMILWSGKVDENAPLKRIPRTLLSL